jgi:hypothetical protein
LDDVIEFPKVKVLSHDEALDYVRREGPIEGISKFAKLIGWERTRAQRILGRWEAARLITMKSGGPGGKTVIEAVRDPAQPPSEPVAQPDAPPAQPDAQLAHLAHQGATVVTLVGRYAAPVLLGAVGIGLSAVGMVETASYAWAIGGLFCALAVSADVLTLTMPAIIAALWRRRSAAVLLAFGLWLGGVAITTANIAGFIGERTEQYQTARETGATERAMTLERLARLRDERKAIIETRPTGAIVAAINNAKRSEQPTLREALAMAKRRDALDAELAFFEQRLGSIPRVTSADASASVLSEISGAIVSEGVLRKFRLASMLGLPLTGGLVLSIAFVLVPTRRPREGIAS